MKGICSVLLIGLYAGVSLAQDAPRVIFAIPTVAPAQATVPMAPAGTMVNAPEVVDAPAVNFNGPAPGWSPRSMLSGTHNFDNFIGFLSNPIMNIDPRAVTELWPVFDSTWVSPVGRLPNGNFQLYGAGLTVALSERLSIGLNQGGYATANFDRFRDGWLNLGGFGQYTIIQNVPSQFLLTAGLRWEAPSGEADVFQGHGPATLAPYLTAGKEFGKFHVLATTGYQFPARSGSNPDTEFFYFNGHIDRQCFGWLYPLFEVNWINHSTSVDINRPFLNNLFNFGTLEATGNIVTMAAGFNAVLIPSRVELGAVYLTPIDSTRNRIDYNGLLVKLVLRY
jgi:hypothetical protein